jgi:hypothetical protein
MNYKGHLNLPKKIHQKEGFGDSTIVIHWGTWYARPIIKPDSKDFTIRAKRFIIDKTLPKVY